VAAGAGSASQDYFVPTRWNPQELITGLLPDVLNRTPLQADLAALRMPLDGMSIPALSGSRLPPRTLTGSTAQDLVQNDYIPSFSVRPIGRMSGLGPMRIMPVRPTASARADLRLALG